MRIIEYNFENWKLGICNFSWFLKNYSCRHIICLAVILDPAVKFPDYAKQIPIGQASKRGRPSAIKSALEIQFTNKDHDSSRSSYSSFDSSDSI